jgi:glyoxylase-like metal-dependent hydrolase (beta-lactamase superfamily II)
VTDSLELRIRRVGPWGLNSYGLICPATRESLLFDPGAEADTLMEMLADSTPLAILITHSHTDHIGALEEMRTRLGVPVWAHSGRPGGAAGVAADDWLDDGARLHVGKHVLRVHHAPGHTSDQICFTIEGDRRAIVGDTIFEGGPGKTWSAEDFRTTLKTLRTVVLAWPDETICYPGHGRHFRLGDRRADIEAFLATDHSGFFGDATWDM